MKLASSPAVILALAVICTFFPMIMTIIAASVLILAHMYAVIIIIFTTAPAITAIFQA